MRRAILTATAAALLAFPAAAAAGRTTGAATSVRATVTADGVRVFDVRTAARARTVMVCDLRAPVACRVGAGPAGRRFAVTFASPSSDIAFAPDFGDHVTEPAPAPRPSAAGERYAVAVFAVRRSGAIRRDFSGRYGERRVRLARALGARTPR